MVNRIQDNTIDIVQLIQTVESKPILYDKSQTDYSNVVLRDDTWIEIAKILKSSGVCVCDGRRFVSSSFFVQFNFDSLKSILRSRM